MSQALIRPQVILSHCIHAFEVRGGRLDSPTNAPAAATQMSAWNKVNHLALVTMVQAAHGPDKDPLVKFDSPALDSMMICLLVCLRVE